ncbi:hypothetical protein [Sediminibacterium sp.]|uniref:hypothetical protein n=1 Tax=Sediminibacterium sp. TaxID=1917865 RepID=UPI00272FE530|nr:hypothetical protein [Sediminibacterium sp.]MDP2421406.1 hypothetical protein [Sediminibacterium sp.]
MLIKKIYFLLLKVATAFAVKAKEKSDSGIVFGILTGSPVLNGCLSVSSPASFIKMSGQNIIKEVINFNSEEQRFSKCKISTEARICFSSREMKLKF